MPSNQDMVAAEVQLMGKAGCESRLRDALQPVREQFDIVLIDCPPALNMLTVNALVAADGVLIPMQCEYYALEGLTALVDTIEQIKAGPNPGLEIDGILRTMFDPRNNLANEVSAQLVEHFRSRFAELRHGLEQRFVLVNQAVNAAGLVVAVRVALRILHVAD